MNWRLLPGMIVLIASPCLAQTDDEASDRCLNAADYKGCMEYHDSKGSSPTTQDKVDVEVTAPSDHNYRASSVRQQKIRGAYGRYLTFVGTTLNEYAGSPSSYNPGSPGRRVCDTTISPNGLTKTTNCRQVGYVAPSYNPGRKGGVERRSFRYQLDCKDLTFDRKGDYSGFGNKGWMKVSTDPTAQAVADRYCATIDSVPKQGGDDDDEG